MESIVRKGFGGAQEGAGRPPHQPTEESRRICLESALWGLPQRFIAVLLKVDCATLRKHYREELDQGLAKGYSSAVKHFHAAIENGEPWAIMKKLGTLVEFRDTHRHEHTGEIEFNHTGSVIVARAAATAMDGATAESAAATYEQLMLQPPAAEATQH